MKKELKSFEELESLLKKHNVTYPKHWESKFKKILYDNAPYYVNLSR